MDSGNDIASAYRSFTQGALFGDAIESTDEHGYLLFGELMEDFGKLEK